MSLINHSPQLIHCKIIYYGPKGSGKTENFKWLHKKYKKEQNTRLLKFSTPIDKKTHFDLLCFDAPKIKTLNSRFYYYTLPSGKKDCIYTRALIKGLDGIVFVADSQKSKLEENKDALLELENCLEQQGYSFETLPVVFQYNKSDIATALPPNELNKTLNKSQRPHFEAQASSGKGVLETFESLNKTIKSLLLGDSHADFSFSN